MVESNPIKLLSNLFYGKLQLAYSDYAGGRNKPCKRGDISNQCAVRMSLALNRCGFGLDKFPHQSRVHSGLRGCHTQGVKHVVGAQELASHLSSMLFAPIRFYEHKKGGGCEHALEAIKGQRGIVYFNNCFRRDGEAHKKGDHIDLFNGKNYFNDINKAGIPVAERIHTNECFTEADRVWFWPI
jgi:hypothetical protein